VHVPVTEVQQVALPRLVVADVLVPHHSNAVRMALVVMMPPGPRTAASNKRTEDASSHSCWVLSGMPCNENKSGCRAIGLTGAPAIPRSVPVLFNEFTADRPVSQ
jgi:hypothetical protein